MPIFQLTDDLIFPHPELANEDGILAVGGDLSPKRILLAYQNGIFPWFAQDEPIIWWSPNPRMVLFPDNLHISKSMRPLFNKHAFKVTFNKNFELVIDACAHPRPNQLDEMAWLTDEMKQAYFNLHKLGFAHSVEVWDKNELVGGLYGISIGGCFFGESMFSKVSNASKYGFITLVQKLKKQGFTLIDCQVHTEHLASLGAELIPRHQFLTLLSKAIQQPCKF